MRQCFVTAVAYMLEQVGFGESAAAMQAQMRVYNTRSIKDVRFTSMVCQLQDARAGGERNSRTAWLTLRMKPPKWEITWATAVQRLERSMPTKKHYRGRSTAGAVGASRARPCRRPGSKDAQRHPERSRHSGSNSSATSLSASAIPAARNDDVEFEASGAEVND